MRNSTDIVWEYSGSVGSQVWPVHIYVGMQVWAPII